MGQLHAEVEPAEVGLDATRLRRIDRHFEHYVLDGSLPGWLVLVARGGKIAHLSVQGMRDVAAAAPVETDTLFRLFSMTKPITSVAAMMLYEEGAFELSDPVSRFIPSFDNLRVYTGGNPRTLLTRPAVEPMRIWHLLTHTSGLTYGFHNLHPIDALYRAEGHEVGTPPGMDLAECCDAWSQFPLLFDPGQRWNYSVATDVLGRIVEVASGCSLPEFFRTRILEPLGMHDTTFTVPPEDANRLAELYEADARGKAVRSEHGHLAMREDLMPSGGGGLVSSAGDYHRFVSMLLGGGKLNGVRLLGDRTVKYMTRNHLPGGSDLETLALGSFSEAANAGKGFGLGFAIVDDPAAGKVLTSAGEYSWGGLASTAFWVDPAEELSVVFLTQLMPSGTHPLRSQLRQLVYQALVD